MAISDGYENNGNTTHSSATSQAINDGYENNDDKIIVSHVGHL